MYVNKILIQYDSEADGIWPSGQRSWSENKEE